MKTILLALCVAAPPAAEELPWWPQAQRPAEIEYESALNDVPSPQRLRGWHELLGSEPHVAGTPGDEQVIERLADAFERMGLEVERHEFWAYLARPRDASVEIVSPDPVVLPLVEEVLKQDPYSGHPDLTIGWNAYSGSGDVTAEVVYVNYGTKEDFKQLGELGVEIDGTIALARYGRNYRGFKAKFAQEAGARGLIIYTDPDDSGYRRGIPYPEGGYANAGSIQRGTIKTLAYPGDPLTPFAPATADAARLDPDDVDLPRIPVQPVGWGAAAEIMSRMRGPAVPRSWQGGLPFAYRLTGGEELRVRLMVSQERRLARSANVLGVLRGSTEPEHVVVVGCHHDAWGCGAGDPLAGTIVLCESARSFAALARRGQRPARTLIFAAWGAEEFGIIGSVEWCEANRVQLHERAVAYVNLDMAAMGPNFRCSAAPSLKRVIESAARRVPQARTEDDRTVFDVWSGRSDDATGPPFGSLGGGSDHIGFYCHLGIPSAGLGAGGSEGVSYHSNYDNLAWYRQVVGDDYEPALMITRLSNRIVARLAAAPLIPLDLRQYGPDTRSHLDDLQTRAEAVGLAADLPRLRAAVEAFEHAAGATYQRLHRAIADGTLPPGILDQINTALIDARRAWVHGPGLPQRPWFRNLFAASDPDSGYAAWMLPLLRYHVERGDRAGLGEAEQLYVDALERLRGTLRSIDELLEGAGLLFRLRNELPAP